MLLLCLSFSNLQQLKRGKLLLRVRFSFRFLRAEKTSRWFELEASFTKDKWELRGVKSDKAFELSLAELSITPTSNDSHTFNFFLLRCSSHIQPSSLSFGFSVHNFNSQGAKSAVIVSSPLCAIDSTALQWLETAWSHLHNHIVSVQNEAREEKFFVLLFHCWGWNAMMSRKFRSWPTQPPFIQTVSNVLSWMSNKTGHGSSWMPQLHRVCYANWWQLSQQHLNKLNFITHNYASIVVQTFNCKAFMTSHSKHPQLESFFFINSAESYTSGSTVLVTAKKQQSFSCSGVRKKRS